MLKYSKYFLTIMLSTLLLSSCGETGDSDPKPNNNTGHENTIIDTNSDQNQNQNNNQPDENTDIEDNTDTDTNTDQDSNNCPPGFTGENCDQCADKHFTGPNCDQCADHFIGQNCTYCAYGFTGDNCDQCANKHFTGLNCDQCTEKFTGPDCNYCSDSRFTGTDCDKCANNRFKGPNCDQCADRFTGANCDQCTDNRFKGENCDQCVDSRFTGPKCDQCADNRFTGANCDQCANDYIGLNCEYYLFKAPDGNTYKTIVINNQTWMAENLRNSSVAHYSADGKSVNDVKYGYLYTFENAKKACPNGWRLPTVDEYLELIGAELYKEVNSSNIRDTSWSNGSNTSGFSALPAGYLDYDGYFNHFGSYAYFWSSTPSGSYYLAVEVGSSNARVSYSNVNNAYSVRCIKDAN